MRSVLLGTALAVVIGCGGGDSSRHLPPETTIDDKPAAITNQTHARIAFHADGQANRFLCQLDATAPAPCTSPFEADVADGDHMFSVSAAIDAVVDGTPAVATWKVDTAPPDTAILTGPPSLDNSLAPVFTFEGSDNNGAVTFECSLDDAAFAACTSPITVAVAGDGSHRYRVRAVDAAGNRDASPATISWTLDSTAPDTMITAGPADAATTAAAVTFEFGSPDPSATLECALDAAAFAACTSPRMFTLADGTHTFRVRAKDETGLVDPTPATRTWTVDATPPDVMITATPNNPSNLSAGTFSFSSTDGTATFACKVDTGAFAACTSAATMPGLADGSHTFTVRASDPVGNSSTASFTWVIDTAPPVVTVTPVATPTNDTTPSVSFTVTGGATSIQCQVDSGAFATCTSPFTPSALADGSHTITVRGTDAAGNPGTGSTTFTVDTAAPVVTVTPVTTPTNDSTPSVAFTVTGGAVSIQCRVDSGTFANCTSPFTPSALADGSHTVTVRGIDAAGNPGTGSTTFTVDTAAPVVTVTAVATPTNNNTPSVTFTVTGGATSIQCRVDSGAFANCTSPFTPASALADGSHTITIQATDAAGNPGTGSTTFTVDTAAPVVTVTPVTTPIADSTPTVSFTVTGGATSIQCRIDAGSFASCTSPFTPATALADGSHTITVRATDAATNTGSDATTFTVDTTPPPVAFDDVPPAQWPVNYFTMQFHTTEASATLACSLNGAAFTACTSPLAITTAYNVTSTFAVRASDALGNSRTISTSWTSSTGLVLHYPWEQGQTHNTSLLAQDPAFSPDGTVTLPVVGGWAGTAAGSPAAHTYKNTIQALSSSADGGYTASIWIRVASVDSNGTVLSTLTPNNGFALLVSGRQVSLRVNDGGKVFTANGVLLPNQWNQLAVITTGPGRGLQLLINGTSAGTAVPPSSTGFGPGQAADLTVGAVNGIDLDDLRFYNRALASSEICPLLVRGQMNAQGLCVPLIAGFELDFENQQIRDTGAWSLAFTPAQDVAFVPTTLGTGVRLSSSGQPFGYTQGFASQVSQAPGHSFSFWFVAGTVQQTTLINFLHTPVGAVGNFGIRITYLQGSGLNVDAGNGSTTLFSKKIPVADGAHSVVVTEQKTGTDGTTASLSVYVDGAVTVMQIGSGNVYANPSDSVALPQVAGTTVDEYEFWPRDLSANPEMLCENGWDGEWNPATASCLLTSNPTN